MSEDTISEARLAANRANALKSTGATSPEGKAIVRFNAVKNGLTGQHMIVREEEAALYSTHIADYERQFQPVGPEECALVRSIADIRWRLNRIPGLELALLARGEAKLVDEFPHLADFRQSTSLESEARLRLEKPLRNLQLQESRLTRRREKEMAELLRLQDQRKSREEEALAEAAKAALLARHRKEPATAPAKVGFAFSKQRFDTYFARLTRPVRQKLLSSALAEAAELAQTEAAAA